MLLISKILIFSLLYFLGYNTPENDRHETTKHNQEQTLQMPDYEIFNNGITAYNISSISLFPRENFVPFVILSYAKSLNSRLLFEIQRFESLHISNIFLIVPLVKSP